MKALVIDFDTVFADGVCAALRRSGFDTQSLSDGAEGLAKLRAEKFDLLITEWLLPSVDGISIVRQLRSAGASPPVVMCSLLSQREAREHAVRAGAAEFLVKPLSAEVVARSAARLSSSLVNEIKSAWAAGDAVMAQPAWRERSTTLVRLLADATGLELRSVAVRGKKTALDCDVRATLGMVDTEKKIALETGLFVSLASGRAMAQKMLGLGAAAEDDVKELLMELCNQSLGALKASLRSADVHFTLSVPSKTFVPLVDQWAAQFPVRDTIWLEADNGVSLTAALGLKPSGSRTVEIAELRENMVLAEDLMSVAGLLLLAAGTRLTSTTIQRLRAVGAKQLAPKQKIHVGA